MNYSKTNPNPRTTRRIARLHNVSDHGSGEATGVSPGPASGTTVDGNGEEKVIVIRLPVVGDVISCAGCVQQNRGRAFLTQRDLIKHVTGEHEGVDVKWACRTCNKVFKGSHNVLCHFPKCKGEQEIPALPHVCCKCERSFRTPRALSIHEMHEHPDVRNLKRQNESEGKRVGPAAKPGRRATAWTEEDTELLRKLNEGYKNERYPNVKLREHFPDKTLKQISDKRREIEGKRKKAVREVAVQEGTVQEGAVHNSDGSLLEEPNEVIQEEPVQTDADIEEGHNREDTRREELEEWKRTLFGYAEDLQRPDNSKTEDLHRKANALLQQMQAEPEATEKIDKFIEEDLIPYLLRNAERENKNKNEAKKHNKRGDNKKKCNHSARKRYSYARCQDMYKNCPKRLAGVAIDGNPETIGSRVDPPPGRAVADFYDALWGAEGPSVDLPTGGTRPVSLLDACPAITASDVSKRISRIKRTSAYGPDKIKRCHLQESGVKEILAKLYNLLLYTGHYPTSWKMNRTTLLPKLGKDLARVENWRPITIGSMMARVMSGILDEKLRKYVNQSSRQKGFTSENGCKHNNILLDRAISHMKEEGGGVIVIVDISKAFDTVPHSIIEGCLLRKGVPRRMADYIKTMYVKCKTRIRAKEGDGPTVELRRGVKQGDPLSPMIFNLAVEPVIERINQSTRGIGIDQSNLSVLAFADDMVLIADTKVEAQKQVTLLGDYLEDLGMSLAANKCKAFQIVPRNKTWFIKNPALSVKDTEIPYCEPGESVSYLGANINPWSGLIRDDGIPRLVKAVGNIERLKLKPHQKIELFKTYVMPHFIHGLVTCPPSSGALRAVDGDIRQCLKRMLHLPLSVTDGLFYTPTKCGGLGIPRLEQVVKLSVLKSAVNAEQAQDPA